MDCLSGNPKTREPKTRTPEENIISDTHSYSKHSLTSSQINKIDSTIARQVVISAEKKNKAGKRGRVCWWRGRVAVLNRMVRKCLMEQVTSVQRCEGGKGVSHGDSLGRAEGIIVKGF